MAERGTFVYEFSHVVVSLMLRHLGRLDLAGVEHVPPNGPLIVAANHLSNIDPVLLGAIFPRPIVFMGKEELAKLPGMGPISRAYGAFSVRRGEADRAAIRRSLEVLAAGRVLGLFPEGTRSRGGGLQEAKAGTGLIAIRSRAPVIPVGISGTAAMSPKRALFGRPEIRIRIGPPVPSPRIEGPLRGAAQAHTDRVMQAIAELLPEMQRGRHGVSTSAEPQSLERSNS
jgi:1-acyl-sn-glycerol-3-phosphate acyltransferase